MSLEDFIITVFCLVDDALKKILSENRLRQRDPHPKVSDSGIITMGLVSEYQGTDTELSISIISFACASVCFVIFNPPNIRAIS